MKKISFLEDVYLSVVFLTRLPAPGWPEAAARKLSTGMWAFPIDRKSTRLNSSHDQISYAVFCLKKKN